MQTCVPPACIGVYRLAQTLSPDRTFLALDAEGRQVVLKMLDEDCLLRGKLHPDIHDRLARVRELADTSVANLYGVERDGNRVFAVWEYLQGKTFGQRVAEMPSASELVTLARELSLAVESMHALGIVHGRIHAGNVIIDAHNRIRLTHVSPLLYDNQASDLHDVANLVIDAGKARGWNVAAAPATVATLAQWRARLGETSAVAARSSAAPSHHDASPRWRAMLAAGMVTLVGIALAVAVIAIKRQTTRPPVVPPEASPQAMQANR